MPQGVVPQAGDGEDVSIAIENRDRFARMDPGKLWPDPADKPFVAESIDTLAVSGNGSWALLCSRNLAWLLNTQTMVSGPPIELPGAATRSALDHEGSVAVLICADTLYRLDLAAEQRVISPIWSSGGVEAADVLALSADGRIAVTTEYRQEATVRVFDLELSSLTHSFVADSDECLLLHPAGRHIFCFGDDGIVRVFGSDGIVNSLHQAAGGALSSDGKTLLINSHMRSEEDVIRLHTIHVSGANMELGPERPLHLGVPIQRWNCKATISPNGRTALVESNTARAIRVDLQSGEAKQLELRMERKTAIVAGESHILSPYVRARDLGIDARGVAVVNAETGDVAGIVCAARGQPANLVCMTSLGLYGSIEEAARPTQEDFALPYERPELISSYLSQSKFTLERGDQLCLEEVQSRRRAWQPYLGRLTADIEIRQLIALSRGIIELTSEIVELADTAAKERPHFGEPQLHLAALQSAASELSALSIGARQARFAQMIARLRHASHPPVAQQPLASTIIPSTTQNQLPLSKPAPQDRPPPALAELEEVKALALPADKEESLAIRPKSAVTTFVVPAIGATLLAALVTLASYLLLGSLLIVNFP